VDLLAGTELIKLLLQVVTADDVVSAAERAVLTETARRIAGPEALEVIRLALDEGKPLPAPNLSLLMQHRGEVLREVARVAAVDGIHRDELDMVKVIGGLLL
jgi:hypothetical protein